MKKNFFYILVFVFGILNYNFTFANESNSNFCSINNSPSSALLDYYKSIENELSEISKNSKPDQGLCSFGNYQKVTSVFDIAYANINSMKNLGVDFAFNTKIVWKWDSPKAISRDEKIFENLEKRVENTVKSLSQKCALNSVNRQYLADIIIEINDMKNIYQLASLNEFVKVDNIIRPKNHEFARQIQQDYWKFATSKCEPKNNSSQSFFDTLSWIFDLWTKKEKSLETWKKAAELITSAHSTQASAQMIKRQKSILQAELSRQWLSSSSQKVMLDNFTCYKSKISDPGNITDAALARISCANTWITWVEEVSSSFEIFKKSSKNSDEFARKDEALIATKSRSIDIGLMYNKLDSMLSVSNENNDSTRANLIKLHSDLVFINEQIEQRIPRAQSNCMKWNPNIVGGCR